jgi:hypothetical protein
MKRFWRAFLLWYLAVSFSWFLLNLPHGSFKFKAAGFPLVFAFWFGPQLEWYKPMVLIVDILVGIIVAGLVALLCAWSRRRKQRHNG